MALDAAVNGQGVSVARSALASWDLATGRLTRPFALSLPVPYAYWIVCPRAVAQLPKIVLFRDWLLAEAASDNEESQSLTISPAEMIEAPIAG
jgi:LysR family glycine cleavage system transcriptional activator